MTAVSTQPRGQGASGTCQECEITFYGPPSVVRNRRWCSWECRAAKPRDARSKERLTWSCETCGVEKLQQPSEMGRRFCSLDCRNARWAEGRKRRVLVACGHCLTRFEKRPSEIAAGRGKFCSRRCANLARPLSRKPSRIAAEAISVFRNGFPQVAAVDELRVHRFAIDLALPELMLAIELDGVYWHSLPEMQAKDRRKDEALAAHGWRVIRIPINRESTAESLAAAIAEAVESASRMESTHEEALST